MTTAMTYKQYREMVKPVRKKPVQRESQLQQSAVRWFRYTYPQYKDLLFSIPNGGHRNKVTAARMKAEGQVAGVPDLFLAISSRPYHGLFIEMKSGGNKLSVFQRQIINQLADKNYRTEIANSIDQFQAVINSYLS